jgi:phosphonate transport system permease protein
METIYIAIIGTVVGGILAIPMAVLAARNLSLGKLIWFADRNFMNILRTLPDLFWAMLFAAAVGFGPVAGAWRCRCSPSPWSPSCGRSRSRPST